MSKVVLSDVGFHSTQHLSYKHKHHQALSECSEIHLLPKGWGAGSQGQCHGQWGRGLASHGTVPQHLGEMSRADPKIEVGFNQEFKFSGEFPVMRQV